MTGTSKSQTYWKEKRRPVKGVKEPVIEYIPKLRTEPKAVGCDGRTRYRARV